MNKVILTGRLCTDVDLRHTQNDKAVATYRLAVNRDFKKDGQPDADFLNCVAWGKTAEWAAKYLRKGTKITIEGRIETRSYDDKDGKKVYVTEIIVDRHEFCESKNSGDNIATATPFPAPVTSFPDAVANSEDFMPVDGDDDLPF